MILPPVIYIAGPFRSRSTPYSFWEQEQNIRRAEVLALEVWRRGGAVICPHTNTRFYQGAAPDHVWLDGDLALLAKSDAVLMTPDWRLSSGARTEHDFAVQHKIPIFYSVEELASWLAGFTRPTAA